MAQKASKAARRIDETVPGGFVRYLGFVEDR
jgi:hypothetical protein